MNKSLVTSLALACGASVLGQGHVELNNRVAGVVITHIYGPDPASPYASQSGNGPSDFPAGSVDWSAYPLLAGSGYTVQLWAAPGDNQPESSLQPATPTTTMRTDAGAGGFIAAVTATMPNVPGGPGSGDATVLLRVWDNRGGTITSWGMAQAAGGSELLGQSQAINVPGPIAAAGPPNLLVGLQSFNIYQVPEPSVLTFAGLGALILFASRPRKRPDSARFQRPLRPITPTARAEWMFM